MMQHICTGRDRVLADETHWNSDERYRTLVGNLPGAVYRCSFAPKWTIDYISEVWTEICGYPASDFVGDRVRSFLSLIHPEDWPRIEREAKRAIARRKPYVVEYRIRHANGTYRWVWERGQAIYSQGGEVLHLDGFVVDITERKLVEDESRQQKEILQKIFDHIPLMISFWDDQRSLKLVNREWESTFGWTVEELRKRKLDILTATLPKPEASKRARDFIARAAGEWVDFRLLLRDGRYIDTIWASVRLSDGTTICIGKDITERKRSEDALRASESQLAEAQRLAHVGSWNFDVTRRVVTWSDEQYRIHGVAPETFVPSYEAFLALVHPDDRAAVRSVRKRALTRREPFDSEHRIIRPDGTVRFIQSRGEVVVDRAGRAIRMFGTTQDITDRRQSEDELRRLSGRLMETQDEERRRIARELHDSTAQGLSALALNLRALTEMMLPRTVPESQIVADSLSLAEQCCREIRTMSYLLHPPLLDEMGLMTALEWLAKGFTARSGITVKLIRPRKAMRMGREMETALFRIVQECLTNVRMHSRASTAQVRLTQRLGQVRLEISDRGRGIPAAKLAGGAENVGVGILGMRERVRQLGGKLEIEPSTPGTKVTATLPLKRATP